MPQMFDDVGEIVEEALRRVGKRVVLALPLGIGKPNLIANEFFRRARGDATLDLTIFTALSLRKPTGSSPLEKAFIDPLAARVFGNYPDLDYLAAMRRNDVPANVRIIEFFFEPGSQLHSAHAQSHYLCANYTHVARELLARGVNVIAHVVAKRVVGGNTEISLGSNPDVTVDLLPEVAKLRAAGTPVVMLGQVHREMPFMLGAANLPADDFDLLLDHSRYDYDLFAPPNPSLSTVDHAIGLHASSLVRDGGTLQIGIGELGDSIVYSLLLRHQQNEAWRRALVDAGTERSAALIDSVGGRAPFTTGLFGATEMFVDQMLDLYRAGILRRRVYDYLPLQRALATNGSITRIDESLLEALLAAGAGPLLDRQRRGGAQEFRRPAQRNALRKRQHHLARRLGDRGESRQRQGTSGAGARMPRAAPAGRHGHACRVPARPAFFLFGPVRIAGERTPPVRHAGRGLHQPALRRRCRRCAWRSAVTRAS